MKYNRIIGWGNIFIVKDEEAKREGLNLIMNNKTNQVSLS